MLELRWAGAEIEESQSILAKMAVIPYLGPVQTGQGAKANGNHPEVGGPWEDATRGEAHVLTRILPLSRISGPRPARAQLPGEAAVPPRDRPPLPLGSKGATKPAAVAHPHQSLPRRVADRPGATPEFAVTA